MMFELPLFPLNTVLFPGMPIKLHIFEERYKLMINRCYEAGTPFGIVLIQSGQEVGGDARPVLIGCTAAITEMEPLPGGRLNIVAVGHERFQIVELHHDQPYLVGLVQTYPFANPRPVELDRVSSALRPWVRKYLRILADASKTPFDDSELPGDPIRLACLASYLLNIPAAQKQDLLNAESAGALIGSLRKLYRREVTLLDAMLVPQPEIDAGPFSLN